jgi:hypothetical protein
LVGIFYLYKIMRTILLILFFIAIKSMIAQQIDTATLLKSNMKFNPEKVRILFGMNYTYAIPTMLQQDKFVGEYQTKLDTLGGINISNFIEYNDNQNLRKDYTASNLQITMQANFWNKLYNGIHYQFFSIKNYKRVGGSVLSKKNSFFFAIATSIAYSFEFLKNKNLHIMPSFRIGGYTADNYYDSKGKKLYLGFDCKFRYLIKNKFGFSAGIDYDYFRYKYKGYSSLFQKDTYQKTTLNNMYFNIGFAYNINIKLDK